MCNILYHVYYNTYIHFPFCFSPGWNWLSKWRNDLCAVHWYNMGEVSLCSSPLPRAPQARENLAIFSRGSGLLMECSIIFLVFLDTFPNPYYQHSGRDRIKLMRFRRELTISSYMPSNIRYHAGIELLPIISISSAWVIVVILTSEPFQLLLTPFIATFSPVNHFNVSPFRLLLAPFSLFQLFKTSLIIQFIRPLSSPFSPSLQLLSRFLIN